MIPNSEMNLRFRSECGCRAVMTDAERVNVRVGIIGPGPEAVALCRQCWTGLATSLLAATDVTQLKMDLLPQSPPMTDAQRQRYEKLCMRCNWLSTHLNDPALKEPNPN